LKYQLVISSVLLTPLLYLAAIISLPSNFKNDGKDNTPVQAFVCTLVGLWGGFIIGY
jgi:hypothetical protein